MTITKKIINLVAAPLLVVLTLVIAFKLVGSKTTPPTQTPKIAIAKVDVMQSAPSTVRPVIQTFGNTQSYLSTTLSSQVPGEILKIAPDFETGNAVSKGDWLVQVDPTDYQSALASRKSSLATAQQSLAEELTRSKLAQEDWLASGRDLAEANDFTLRKPQLAAAQAAVDAAQAAVDQAALDLKRATIRAPFDAIVESRLASPGNIVTASSILGKLIARERIQVRLPVTPLQATQLELPRFGSSSHTLTASLTTPTLSDMSWEAKIGRAEPIVDSKNQTLYLIGEVEKPFDNSDAFLPIGAFVNASITGKPLRNVHTFPEVAVVDDAFVWVVGPDNLLAKQSLTIVFSQNSEILARIDAPLFELPLTVALRPLASFKEGQTVEPQSDNIQ